MVFIVMWGLIGSFRGARGPEGVSAGRSRGPGGQGFNRLEGPFFVFEGLFIMFFVLRALRAPLAMPRCPQRALKGSSGDPWVPFRSFLVPSERVQGVLGRPLGAFYVFFRARI